MYVGGGGAEEVLVPWSWSLQVVVSSLMWMLRMDLWSLEIIVQCFYPLNISYVYSWNSGVFVFCFLNLYQVLRGNKNT